MPKSKTAKAVQKADRNYARAAALAQSPTAAVAYNAASSIARVAKKQHKKGGSTFWSVLGGAAKIAAELAPTVLPLLLAKHAPTAQAAGMVGASQPSAGVGIASPASCATCTGLYQSQALKGKDGRVIGMRMCGLDYLGALNVNSEGTGSVLSNISLNPLDPAWQGTSLQRFATLFERYRPHRLAGLIEPSCPSTTPGQLLGFMDPDPADVFDQTGRTAIQVASSHEGADISQAWGLNCAGYAFDSQTQDFYADADGSDERLISPGNWFILANTDMPASTPMGSLYVAWEYSFKIPQIEDFNLGGQWAYQIITDVTGAYPFGTSWAPQLGTLPALLTYDGQVSPPVGITHNILSGLPVGEYVCVVSCTTGACAGAITWTIIGDAAGGYTAIDGGSTITATQTTGTDADGGFESWFRFKVGVLTQDPDLGSITIAFDAFGGSSTIEAGQFWVFNVRSSLTSARRRTLQQVEKKLTDDLSNMRTQLMLLQAQMAIVPAAGGPNGLRSAALAAASPVRKGLP